MLNAHLTLLINSFTNFQQEPILPKSIEKKTFKDYIMLKKKRRNISLRGNFSKTKSIAKE